MSNIFWQFPDSDNVIFLANLQNLRASSATHKPTRQRANRVKRYPQPILFQISADFQTLKNISLCHQNTLSRSNAAHELSLASGREEVFITLLWRAHNSSAFDKRLICMLIRANGRGGSLSVCMSDSRSQQQQHRVEPSSFGIFWLFSDKCDSSLIESYCNLSTTAWRETSFGILGERDEISYDLVCSRWRINRLFLS